jgi:hypothetical protein
MIVSRASTDEKPLAATASNGRAIMRAAAHEKQTAAGGRDSRGSGGSGVIFRPS